MAFSKTAQLMGDNQSYSVNEACKAYTLRDYGFVQTKAGNYEYDHKVRPDLASSRAIRLRVLVDKSIEKLQIQTINDKGMKAVNIYKNEEMADFRSNVEFILADMVERNVLQVAN